MNKLLVIIILLLQALTVSSCATQVNVLKSLSNAKKSIVKIEAHMQMVPCDQDTNVCDNYQLYATGSGSVVLYNRNKVILTAAHICKQTKFGLFVEEANNRTLFKAIDRDDKEYIIEIIKHNIEADICLLQSVSGPMDMPFLKLSPKAPEYAELVYNLAGPLGIMKGEMVPVYRGSYFGQIGNDAFYSIPTIGGSSGSPVLNFKGELIGMIHSVHMHFHHIALSASYKELWNFLTIVNNRTL